MSSRKQTIFKTGNSLAISIPAKIVRRLGLAVGQTAICQPSWHESKITYEFPDAKQLPLLASSRDKDNQSDVSTA